MPGRSTRSLVGIQMTVLLGLKVESLERHQRFISRAVEKGSVWHLGRKTETGLAWAESTSNGDERRRGAGRGVVPVWSDRAYAKQCAKDSWSVYQPFEIPLEQFLSVVLPNMHRAKVLVGTNWNAHLIGYEITPKKLQIELVAALKKRSDAD